MSVRVRVRGGEPVWTTDLRWPEPTRLPVVGETFDVGTGKTYTIMAVTWHVRVSPLLDDHYDVIAADIEVS